MSNPTEQGSYEGANAPTRGDTPRRGRPPGTEETPESLIRRELIAHLKLYKQLREIVARRVTSGGDALSADDLGKLMDLLRKGVVDMARPILAPAKSDSAKVEDEDPQKILKDLLSTGKG